VATRAKKTTKRKSTPKKKASPKAAKRAPARGRSGAIPGNRSLPPKANGAVKKAAESLWEAGTAPHTLLQELHEVLLLRCLKEADGNYAAAAAIFGPSRQSVQQYANSPLRDDRWTAYQQNRRKTRSS